MAKANPEETLLVHDKEDNSVRVVKGVDKKGKLETVEPKLENSSEFLKVNKHGDPFENFISNFKRQLRNPTRFNFFAVRIPLVERTAKKLREIVKNNTVNQQKTKPMETQAPAGQKYRFDPEKINWESLNKFGISKENLPKNTLDTMLMGNKSEELHRIHADFGQLKLNTEARLSFRQMPDGNLALAIHGVRKQPELDKPYFGHKFTDEDKKNLLETGNMGRLAETRDFRTGEVHNTYISIDKLTNELLGLKAEHIRLPHEIKGVKLDDEQKQALHEGKAIFVEGMTSKSGKSFSAHVQINAEKRGLEFRFDNKPKQGQSQGQNIFIPQKIGGVKLSAKQQDDLQGGKTIYVENMTDKKGEQYSAYVKVNAEKGKLGFYSQNPDVAQKEGKAQSVRPDNQHKPQVNANDQGQKTETGKNINTSYKKGQTDTAKKQDEKPQQAQKPKGRKL